MDGDLLFEEDSKKFAWFCRKCLEKNPDRHSRIKAFDFGKDLKRKNGEKPFSLLNRAPLCRSLSFLRTVKLYSKHGTG